MGIEPTEDASQRPPPVLKTGPVTRSGSATEAESSRVLVSAERKSSAEESLVDLIATARPDSRRSLRLLPLDHLFFGQLETIAHLAELSAVGVRSQRFLQSAKGRPPLLDGMKLARRKPARFSRVEPPAAHAVLELDDALERSTGVLGATNPPCGQPHVCQCSTVLAP